MTREIKDSGIEWIGEIPKDWEISTILRNFNSRVEKVSDLDYKPLSVTKNGIVPQLENAAKSANHNDRKLVLKNDFVINSRSDRKMSSGVSSENGSVSLINTVIYSNSILPEYTKYLLKNASFAEEFYRWGTGIVADLWSTNWEKMKKISIPVPPLKEQKKISAILNIKVNAIDEILFTTQQSITELKKYKQSLITEAVTKGLDKNAEMKDSGINWIGEIPVEWTVAKLKYCISIRDESQKFTKNMKYVGLEHIEKDSGQLIGFSEEFNEKQERVFKSGDVLYSKLRPYLAKAYHSDFDGVCSNEFIIFSDFIGNKEFLKFWLISLTFTDQINSTTYGTKMPRANLDLIRNMEIPLPNIQIQDAIVSELTKKSDQISVLIKDKERIINEYEEYKKSLIYEYVTGKKQV